MKILFTSPVLEYPPTGGPQLRISNTIKALSKDHELFVFNRDLAADKKTHNFFRQFSVQYACLDLAKTKPLGQQNKIFKFILKLVRKCSDIYPINQANRLVKCLHENNIKVVWFGYGNISFGLIRLVRKKSPEVLIICDTDSVWSRFILREMPYANMMRKVSILTRGLLKSYEEKLLVRKSDVVTAVSDIDADFYRSLTKQKEKIHIFSNGLDFADYDLEKNATLKLNTPSLIISGSFGHKHSAMNSATTWFLESVFPDLLEVMPKLCLYIVGRNSNLNFKEYEGNNIIVTGMVESVVPYLSNATVAIVPLKFESGTRFKILEAAVCETAIVSTSLGAEGIDIMDGYHLLIANNAKEFVSSILRLLDDEPLRLNMTKNARHFIFQNYGLVSLRLEIKKIVHYIEKL
jgi:glycosyltransferase involved in cell wall biosynthesis